MDNKQKKVIGNLVTLIVGIGFFAFMVLTSPEPANYPPQEKSYQHYVNVYDETVELSDFFGNYLWVDYAAKWCSYCDAQTRTIKQLTSEYDGDVDFLTVVTGTDEVMEAPTVATVREWADRHGLDEQRVIGRFFTDTLPYNLLYSPEGEVLYRGSGLMQPNQIREIIYEQSGR